jgi:hypothetical protein
LRRFGYTFQHGHRHRRQLAQRSAPSPRQLGATASGEAGTRPGRPGAGTLSRARPTIADQRGTGGRHRQVGTRTAAAIKRATGRRPGAASPSVQHPQRLKAAHKPRPRPLSSTAAPLHSTGQVAQAVTRKTTPKRGTRSAWQRSKGAAQNRPPE